MAFAATPLVVLAAVNLPGTQPADGTGDPAYPPFRNGASPGTFQRPGACDNCHEGYRQAGQAIYESFDAWAGTMMAQAARDPLFWAALDLANQDDAALGDPGIGDLCIRCHAPGPWYEGRSHCTTAWGEEFDGACFLGTKDTANNDYEGLVCNFCHRLYDGGDPPPGQFADAAAPYAENAQVYLSTEQDTALGPFTDATSTHLSVGQPFHRGAALCGQCHDVTNVARWARDPTTGLLLGFRMPLQRTYTEYRQSRYADAAAPENATCQECHMPEPDHEGDGTPDDGFACMQATEPRGRATTLQGPLRTHLFAGGSTWMLTVLRDEYAAALGREEAFDAGIEAARRLLTERALRLDVAAPGSVEAGRALTVTARVTNLGGHKFPTGHHDGRRAWVQVAAGEDADMDGQLARAEVAFESGAYDEAAGVLTHDAQAKIYEPLIGAWDYNGTGQCDRTDATGTSLFHQVLNDCTLQDNRIPPLGFVPTPDTEPVGYAYPSNPALPGTLANWDDTTYAIPVPPGSAGTWLVETRVRYQSVSREYVEFLRDRNVSTCDPQDAGCNPTLPDARPNRGEKLHDLWDRSGRNVPVDMVFSRVAVTVVQPPPGEAADVAQGGAPLRVLGVDPVSEAIDVSFGPACDATDHALAWGPLSAVATHGWTGVACGFGAGGVATLDPGPGSWFFVVVGRAAGAEGSYGRTSLLAERPERADVGPCDAPQDLSATCR